jgi:hypothetical protein
MVDLLVVSTHPKNNTNISIGAFISLVCRWSKVPSREWPSWTNWPVPICGYGSKRLWPAEGRQNRCKVDLHPPIHIGISWNIMGSDKFEPYQNHPKSALWKWSLEWASSPSPQQSSHGVYGTWPWKARPEVWDQPVTRLKVRRASGDQHLLRCVHN